MEKCILKYERFWIFKINQGCYLRKDGNASNMLSKKKKSINECLKKLRAKKKKKNIYIYITQVNPCGVHPSSRSTASQEAKVLKYVI